MERRSAFAAIVATAFSVAALTAAVGATTHVFAAGESAGGIGTVSPVSSSTLPPIVEHKVIDVEDPPPAPPPTPVHTVAAAAPRAVSHAVVTAPSPTPVAVPAPAPAPAPAPPTSLEPGDD